MGGEESGVRRGGCEGGRREGEGGRERRGGTGKVNVAIGLARSLVSRR